MPWSGWGREALDRVGVQQGGTVRQQGGNLLHRKPRPGLVVDQHDADQGRVLPQGGEVAREMLAVLTEEFGNPSAQYELGRAARIRLDRDRETVAGALGCRPEQLFFTLPPIYSAPMPFGPPILWAERVI